MISIILSAFAFLTSASALQPASAPGAETPAAEAASHMSQREMDEKIREAESRLLGRNPPGDKKGAFEIFSGLPESPIAQAWLAYMYKHGEGAPKDEAKSREILSGLKGAYDRWGAGDPRFENIILSLRDGSGPIVRDAELSGELAIISRNKRGLQTLFQDAGKDRARLAGLFEKLPPEAYGDFAEEYVSMLFHGDGVERDYSKALKIAESAPRNIAAQIWAAAIHAGGYGTDKDPAKAEKAVAAAVGLAMEEEKGIPGEYKARGTLTQALKKLYNAGDEMLAEKKPRRPKDSGYPQNAALGERLALAAIDVRFVPEMFQNLERRYKREKREERLFGIYKNAYGKGDLKAAEKYAVYSFNGVGTPKDEKGAFEAFQKLADCGDAPNLPAALENGRMRAMVWLSAMHKNGWGTDADAAKSEEYMGKAIVLARRASMRVTDYRHISGLLPASFRYFESVAGLLCGDGGFPQDRELAKKFYRHSASLADMYAMHYCMAQMYILRFLREAEMREEYEKRLAYYSGRGCSGYDLLYINELVAGARVKRDPERAFETALSALENAKFFADEKLGKSIMGYSFQNTPLQLKVWLSYMYQNGIGTDRDEGRADEIVAEIARLYTDSPEKRAIKGMVRDMASEKNPWPNLYGKGLWASPPSMPKDFALGRKYAEKLLESGEKDMERILEKAKE